MKRKIILTMGWTLVVCLTAATLIGFVRRVNLKPQVTENFFFSSQDPAFRSDMKISDLFPQPPQVVIAAKGDIRDQAYLDKVEAFSLALSRLPEVFSVQSLTRGPGSLKDAFESPLWRRMLISEDEKASFISVFIKDVPVDLVIAKIEHLAGYYRDAGFELMISGAPFIMARVQTGLARDFKTFTIAAVIVMSFVLIVIFRTWFVLIGTLFASLDACALTLLLAQILGITIGPLTANLATIVFVLTLSHIVFLTFNWGRLGKKKRSKIHLAIQAVRETFGASVGSMGTTLLGFLSLLLVQATPLKQLGVSGAVGTLAAFAAAYLIYPWFLTLGKPKAQKNGDEHSLIEKTPLVFRKRHTWLVMFLLAGSVIGVTGMIRLNTDPNMLSYFRPGSEIREGLDYIDANGGSSPFKMVVGLQSGEPFTNQDAYQKLWGLHEAFETYTETGSAISLPLLIGEVKRMPLSFFLSMQWIVEMLESEKFGGIAKYFLTPDRKQTLFLLRMKEANRTRSRLETVKDLEEIARKQGFIPQLVGGVYLLQGKLSEILASSLVSGLGMLIVIFALIGWFLSKSWKIALAMFVSVAVIPACLFGMNGYLNIPFDVISAPAVNIAIAIGVDSMIHVLIFVRRNYWDKRFEWSTWEAACRAYWKPVVVSTLVICAGFAIFNLSEFPATERFGSLVIAGTALAPFAALFIFPWAATLKGGSKNKSLPKAVRTALGIQEETKEVQRFQDRTMQ